MMTVIDDFGEATDLDAGFTSGSTARENYRIDPADPTSARADTHWTQSLSREGWSVSTVATANLTSDADDFHTEASVSVIENGREIHRKTWQSVHKRDFI